MSEEWIYRCWDFRDDVAVSANDEHLVMMSAIVFVVNTFLFCITVLIAVPVTWVMIFCRVVLLVIELFLNAYF